MVFDMGNIKRDFFHNFTNTYKDSFFLYLCNNTGCASENCGHAPVFLTAFTIFVLRKNIKD